MDKSILGEVGFHFAVLDIFDGTALLRLASDGVVFGAEGGENGAAHGLFGRSLSHPDLPLGDTLGDEHLDAWDRGDALLSSNLQELCPLRTIDDVHDEPAMQLAGNERRNAVVGMHPDRGGVQNGVKGLRAQSSAGQRLCAEGAAELPCSFLTAGANNDARSGTSQRKNGCSSRSTRSEDQDAATFDAEFLFERTEQAEVVRVAAVERAVAANDHRVNSANFRCERIALLQILENGLLVRMSDAESTEAKFGDGLQKIAKVMHKEREIDGIDATRYESRVVQERRKRMADMIANHSVDPRAARESVRAVKILHVMQRNLARSGSTGDRRVRQGTSLAQSENARGQASLSHRNGNETFGITSQAEEPDAVADGSRLSGDLHGVDSAMRRR